MNKIEAPSYLDNMKRIIWTIPLIAMFCAVACVSCHLVNESMGLEADNFFEEIIEEVIESQTGLDLDLTPGSAE